jgi:uncharacterized cupin superfamily protein
MGLFGKLAQALNSNHENARLTRNLSEAEVRYLEVLRREVANLIVESDPDLMMHKRRGHSSARLQRAPSGPLRRRRR